MTSQSISNLTGAGGNRTRTVLLWTAAVVLTLAAVVYQRVIGPTRPVRGSVVVGEEQVDYQLDRSHGGSEDHQVVLELPSDQFEGRLFFKRYPTNDTWTEQAMVRNGVELTGTLPHQASGGKVLYYLTVRGASGPGQIPVTIPATEPVVLRFRGGVPAWALIPHVLLMFFAMLWSNRAGLEGLSPTGDPRKQTLWALALMALGGLVFGPLVQWYAFGAFWTGFPVGYDLTDNKTLIAAVAWLLAFAFGRRNRGHARWWAVGAAVVTLIIFSIPHSVLGTELDYSAAASAQ